MPDFITHLVGVLFSNLLKTPKYYHTSPYKGRKGKPQLIVAGCCINIYQRKH
jgi:hypothetical protein